MRCLFGDGLQFGDVVRRLLDEGLQVWILGRHQADDDGDPERQEAEQNDHSHQRGCQQPGHRQHALAGLLEQRGQTTQPRAQQINDHNDEDLAAMRSETVLRFTRNAFRHLP